MFFHLNIPLVNMLICTFTRAGIPEEKNQIPVFLDPLMERMDVLLRCKTNLIEQVVPSVV
jgi:hypothetical protein